MGFNFSVWIWDCLGGLPARTEGAPCELGALTGFNLQHQVIFSWFNPGQVGRVSPPGARLCSMIKSPTIKIFFAIQKYFSDFLKIFCRGSVGDAVLTVCFLYFSTKFYFNFLKNFPQKLKMIPILILLFNYLFLQLIICRAHYFN